MKSELHSEITQVGSSDNFERTSLMKSALIVLCFFVGVNITRSQEMYFPPIGDTTWQHVSFSELGWCEEKLDSLFEFLDANDTKAFIVLKNGRIAIEHYADGFFVDDNWYWASAGKTVTSTLVGIAQQEGKLTLADTSSTYLGKGWSSLTPEQEAKITVRHHLTMTSGLDDGTGDPYCTEPQCLVYKADAGTRWAYHNGPYTLLDKIIQNATGDGLNVYYDKKLKRTVGMNGLFIKDGFNNVLFTTPRAMARFGLLALNNFDWNGTAIITDKTFAHDATTRSQELNQSYGYLWWLNGQPTFMLPGLQFVFNGPLSTNEPPDAFNGLGKNDQIVSVVPSKGLVVIRLGNAANANGPQVPTIFLNDMWGLMRNVMCEPTSIEMPNAERRMPNSNVGMANSGQRVASYQMYDVMGRMIESLPETNDLQAMSYNLSTGVYFVVAVSETGQPLFTEQICRY